MKSTEKSTQATVIDYLSLKHRLFWRQNSGTFQTKTGGYYRFTSMNGMPDIFCLHEGILYGLEIKDVKGKLQESQILFQDLFIKAGGKYIIVRSLEDVMAIL